MNNNFANQLANNDQRRIVEKLNTYTDRYGEEPELYYGFSIGVWIDGHFHSARPGQLPEKWFIEKVVIIYS